MKLDIVIPIYSLSCSTGDAVSLMEGDLQNPTELIPNLISLWKGGANVGRAQSRKPERERNAMGRFRSVS